MITNEPLYCSQGGVPYNKPHLDAKDAEIKRLRAERDDAREQRRKWQEASATDRAESERLRAMLHWTAQHCLDQHCAGRAMQMLATGARAVASQRPPTDVRTLIDNS